jgi:large subunit ribosomal protein L18
MRISKRTIRRRRRENKTDYKLRKKILEGGMPRLVIRRTNRYFIIQLVKSSEAQDKILMTMTSKELVKHGWNEKSMGSLKSIPAGYLTGLLAAKKVGKERLAVDLGMQRTIAGGRVFSVVKGLIDGGANISANEKVFPSDERLEGEHLKPEVKEMINKIKSKIK